MRPLWQAVGWTSVALGAAGIVLPLLPTTPFLLLAAWCFARSSERFHAWLVDHPRLGPPIADWRREGAIAPWAKVAAAGSMLASLALSVPFGVPSWALALQAACLAGAATFVLTRPAPRKG